MSDDLISFEIGRGPMRAHPPARPRRSFACSACSLPDERSGGCEEPVLSKEQKEVRPKMRTLVLMAFVAATLITLGILT